jgi:hypothetical protein
MFVAEWRAIRSGLLGFFIRLAGFLVMFALLGMFIQMVTGCLSHFGVELADPRSAQRCIRYLQPPSLKLDSRDVESVESRCGIYRRRKLGASW